MSCRWVVGLVAIASVLVSHAAPAAVSSAPDRLDRFRELAGRVGSSDPGDSSRISELYRELYTLVDEEVVENLASGPPYSSTPFLQDRLDVFSESWGAASFRLLRAGRLLVGAFALGDANRSGTVRVYGPLAGAPALLTVLAHDGRPHLHPLGPTASGAAQVLVAWEGRPSAWGSQALRLDLLREEPGGAQVVWSTANLFADGLYVRGYAIRDTEIALRYEVHYPGWTPGCEGQTEEEDVYRFVPARSAFVRTSSRQLNAWHRSLRAAVVRFLDALGSGKAAELTRLVPDPAVRRRLPGTLRPEPVCDARDPAAPDSVSVAAATTHGEPWTLVFKRAGESWRLATAAPVIE